MYNNLMVEGAQIIPAFGPKDITGAAQVGDYINMKHARKCAIVLQKGAWGGGTPAVTLEQATNAAGAGSKALAFDRQYVGTGLTNDVLAQSAVAASTFNLSATANEYHVIEVDAGDLDHANGFFYLTVKVASPGAFADLLSATYFLYQHNFVRKPANRPTAIT